MDNEKYYQLFMTLGISVESLPLNYTPEEYGRKLLSLNQYQQGVSYSNSTDYVYTSQNKQSFSCEK